MSTLPAGEVRAGQVVMAEAVAKVFASGGHVAVAAGTGTGKSLAYLVPAVISHKRVVVATATKALQDQLANKDLPLVARGLGQPVKWAVLKGRSNYLCRQRLESSSASAPSNNSTRRSSPSPRPCPRRRWQRPEPGRPCP